METVVFSPTIDAFVEHINEYLTGFKELTEANAKEIIEHIKVSLQPLYIKVSYEHLSCLERINKARDAAAPAARRFRFILSTNRYKANFQYQLVRQSNGLICHIIETQDSNQNTTSTLTSTSRLTCQVLAIPPNDFNPHFTHDSLFRSMKSNSYDVYEISDGTTVNLYYDPQSLTITSTTKMNSNNELATIKQYQLGKWVFGTKNAIVVDDMIWRGTVYRTVIEDVLKQYSSFNFDTLDKTKCYSFGFKHPAFHPFGQPAVWSADAPSNQQWLICAWGIRDSDAVALGIPTQTKLTNQDISTMFQHADKAMDNYMKNNKNVFLGYIIRSQSDNETLELSDILIESSLWSEIRQCIYQLPFIKNKNIRDKQEQNFKNMTYVVLDSYLDFRKKTMFITLFPQFTGYYTRYNNIINAIVDRIMKVPEKEQSPDRKIIDALLLRLGEHVNLTYTVNPKNYKNDKKVLRHLICHPRYTELYFQIIHGSE